MIRQIQMLCRVLSGRVVIRNLIILSVFGCVSLWMLRHETVFAGVVSTTNSILPCLRSLVDLHVQCETVANCEPEETVIIIQYKTSKTCQGVSLKAYGEHGLDGRGDGRSV